MRQNSRTQSRTPSRAAAATKSVGPRTSGPKSIADGLSYRHLGVDDLSNVRYLHSLACRCMPDAAGDDIADYLSIAGSPDYAALLLSERHILAFCGDELVGSAGWSIGGSGKSEARLSSVFVHPLFTRLGIARRLVAAVEADVRALGFERLVAPLPTHAGPFLRRVGFAAEPGDGIIARAAPGLGLVRRLVPASGAAAGRRRGRKALSAVGQG